MMATSPVRSASPAADSLDVEISMPAVLRRASTIGDGAVSLATTATLMRSGARLRKAIPSPAASSTGKMKTQKTASGSRKNSRYRTRVSCTRGCLDQRRVSVIAKVSASERHKDVFQGGGVSAQLGQLGTLSPQLAQEGRHGQMKL